MTDALIRSEDGGVGRADQIRPQRLYPVLKAFADLLAGRLTGKVIERMGLGPGADSFVDTNDTTIYLKVLQTNENWNIWAEVSSRGRLWTYKQEGERWVLLDTEPHTGVTDEEFLGVLARLFD